jgi:hypothetical protein
MQPRNSYVYPYIDLNLPIKLKVLEKRHTNLFAALTNIQEKNNTGNYNGGFSN